MKPKFIKLTVALIKKVFYKFLCNSFIKDYAQLKRYRYLVYLLNLHSDQGIVGPQQKTGVPILYTLIYSY